MRAQTVIFTFVAVLFAGAAEARTASFADRLTVHGDELLLQGTGVLKYKRLLSLYDIACYLPADLENPLSGETPLQLEVVYRRDLPAAKLNEAGEQILARNFDADTMASIRDPLNTLNALFPDAKKGDRCAISYHPSIGVEVTINGKQLGAVPGADFASKYFAIWLGTDPADPKLRDRLLGR